MKALEETASKHKQDIKHLRTTNNITRKKTWEETYNYFVWRVYKGKCGNSVNKGKDKLHLQVQIPTHYSGKVYV